MFTGNPLGAGLDGAYPGARLGARDKKRLGLAGSAGSCSRVLRSVDLVRWRLADDREPLQIVDPKTVVTVSVGDGQAELFRQVEAQ